MKESKTIYYKRVGKYQTNRRHMFKTALRPKYEAKTGLLSLKPNGTLIIERFYSYDGPSGPTKFIANRLPRWLRIRFLKKFMRGSLAHDALFELFRRGKLNYKWFEAANLEMKRLCKEDGMWGIRVKYTFFAVNKFAHAAAAEKNKRKILTAP